MLRDGAATTSNFGSAAGELAACVSAVGLADCSQIVKLELEGHASHLRELVSDLAGAELAPGGAVFSGGAWWCAQSDERVIVLADPRAGARLRAQLHSLLMRHAEISLADRTESWAALSVIGLRTHRVLADLGVYGDPRDPRQVSPLTTHTVAGVDVIWLLENDHKVLALTPSQEAGAVWQAIEHAGHRHGICAVGQEALARYALIRHAQSWL